MGLGRKKGDTYKTHLWPDGYRECVQCNKLLPFSMFHKHSGCYNGYNTVCKECRKPVSRKQWETKTIVYKMLTRCKSRATANGLDFSLTEEDLIIPEICPILKTPFDTSTDYCPSVDRIDSTKGYVKGNVQVISNKANRMKSNATNEELRLFAAWIKSGVCEI